MNQIADGMGRNGTGDYEYKTKCVIQLLLLHSALLGRRRSTLQQQRIHFQKPIDKWCNFVGNLLLFRPTTGCLPWMCSWHSAAFCICLSVCLFVLLLLSLCGSAGNGGCSWTCELLLLLLMRQEKQSHQGLHRLPTVVAKQNIASSNYSSAPTRSWNTTYKQCRWTYNDVDVYFTTKEKSTTTTLVFRSVPFFLYPPPSSTTTPYSPYSFLIFLFFNTLKLTTTLIIISF